MKAFLFGGSNDGVEVEVNELLRTIKIPILNSSSHEDGLKVRFDVYIKCDAIFRKDYLKDHMTGYFSFKEMEDINIFIHDSIPKSMHESFKKIILRAITAQWKTVKNR